MGVRVTIDDLVVLNATEASWELTMGTRPHIGSFMLSKEDVNTLIKKEGPVVLHFDDGNHQLEIQNLFVIGDAPGPNPHIQQILLADRRYWWAYSHVLRRFNKRRHIGHKRIGFDDVRELEDVPGNVWYAPYSLPEGNPNSEPWKVTDALTNVFDELIKSDPFPMPGIAFALGVGERGPGGSLSTGTGLDDLPFENVEIDDNGQDAVRRLLDYLPGVNVTIGADGTIYIFSRVDGGEEHWLNGQDERAEMKGFGHLRYINQDLVRPSEIHVLFSREFEIRVDFAEYGTSDTFAARGEDDIYAENVMPSPDYNFTLSSGDTVPRGAYITFDQALGGWESDPMPSGATLTMDFIRMANVPFVDLWAIAGLHGLDDPDDDWASRIAACQSNFRRTLRINRRFIDRTFAIYDYRLATINPETGTRAPAICYADYAVLPGQRMLMQDSFSDRTYIVNVEGYPGAFLTRDARPAPCRVVVTDRDQGIISLEWKIDPSRTFEQILPGTVRLKGSPGGAGTKPTIPGPTADLTDRQRPIGFNAVVEGGEAKIPELTTPWEAIILMTAVPASPNNDAQLERVVVRPEEIAELLPPHARPGLGAARGPIMEVRIGPGVETARVRWDDARRDDIYRAMGITNDQADGAPPDISDLIINGDAFGARRRGFNAASLRSIADATAAQVYAEFTNRVEGQAAFAFRDEVRRLQGRISSIRFAVTTDGLAHLQLTVPREYPAIHFHSLLPASDRALIAKLAGKES